MESLFLEKLLIHIFYIHLLLHAYLRGGEKEIDAHDKPNFNLRASRQA